MWQYSIVFIVLAFAVGYAAWRTYRLTKKGDEPCCGDTPSCACNGCEGCPMKKQLCDKKKEQEKFCCSKNN